MKSIATLPCLMSVSKTNVQGRVKATYAVRMVQRFGPNILLTAALILLSFGRKTLPAAAAELGVRSEFPSWLLPPLGADLYKWEH